jgi:DNA-binding GntR family transcriptional regulator
MNGPGFIERKVFAIQRRPLHDEIVEKMRAMISEGELLPGTRVPEKLLCDRFGVSRTPLREALKVLASEGLVDLYPNRGAVIATLQMSELEEMFPVLGHLEALAGELACENITEDELAEIRALHYQMVVHFRRGERPDYFRLNQEIHARILQAAKNKALAGVHGTLAGRIRHARYLANMTHARWTKAVEEHEEILDALSRRDGPRLARILKAHLANKFESVRESMSQVAEQDALDEASA